MIFTPLKKPFHSRHLTFRPARDSDASLFAEYIEQDEGNMLLWFGMASLKDSEMTNIEKGQKLVNIYNRNSTNKKQMLHIFSKHTNQIIGVANLWIDKQRNPRIALYLTTKHRRRGFGKEAYNTISKKIWHHGQTASTQITQIKKENSASIRMFYSLGFRALGVRRFAIPNSTPQENYLTLYRPAPK